MTKSILPTGQDWLIERMRELGYRVDMGGMCFGIAAMALQEALVGGLEDFERRLLLINNTPNLKDAVEAAKAAKRDLLAEARVAVIDKYHAKWEDLLEAERDEIREEIEFLLTQQEHDLLAIEPFFDGINLYFYASFLYRHFFNEENVPIGQDLLRTFILAKHALDQDEIINIRECSGIYDQAELTSYFAALRQSFSDLTNPITLFLSSVDHAMMVIWSPSNKSWILVNPNKLPFMEMNSDQAMAAAVLAGFSDNALTAFSTQFFTKKGIKEEVESCLPRLEMNARWKGIHTPTVEKARQVDSANASWFRVAVDRNHEEVALQLLTLGTDLILTDTSRNGALFSAAQYGHLRLVNKMLEIGADPNMKCGEATPLFVAALEGHKEVVRALLASKADPRIGLADGMTPLQIAARFGHIEIATILADAVQQWLQRSAAGVSSVTGQSVSSQSLFRELPTPPPKKVPARKKPLPPTPRANVPK